MTVLKCKSAQTKIVGKKMEIFLKKHMAARSQVEFKMRFQSF